MGRTDGKLVKFLRDALLTKKYKNLSYEDEECDIFYLIFPRYDRKRGLPPEFEAILKDWYITNKNLKYLNFSSAKGVLKSAMKKSVYLISLKSPDKRLRFRFAKPEEVIAKRKQLSTKPTSSEDPPSVASSGYHSGSERDSCDQIAFPNEQANPSDTLNRIESNEMDTSITLFDNTGRCEKLYLVQQNLQATSKEMEQQDIKSTSTEGPPVESSGHSGGENDLFDHMLSSEQYSPLDNMNNFNSNDLDSLLTDFGDTGSCDENDLIQQNLSAIIDPTDGLNQINIDDLLKHPPTIISDYMYDISMDLEVGIDQPSTADLSTDVSKSVAVDKVLLNSPVSSSSDVSDAATGTRILLNLPTSAGFGNLTSNVLNTFKAGFATGQTLNSDCFAFSKIYFCTNKSCVDLNVERKGIMVYACDTNGFDPAKMYQSMVIENTNPAVQNGFLILVPLEMWNAKEIVKKYMFFGENFLLIISTSSVGDTHTDFLEKRPT